MKFFYFLSKIRGTNDLHVLIPNLEFFHEVSVIRYKHWNLLRHRYNSIHTLPIVLDLNGKLLKLFLGIFFQFNLQISNLLLHGFRSVLWLIFILLLMIGLIRQPLSNDFPRQLSLFLIFVYFIHFIKFWKFLDHFFRVNHSISNPALI